MRGLVCGGTAKPLRPHKDYVCLDSYGSKQRDAEQTHLLVYGVTARVYNRTEWEGEREVVFESNKSVNIFLTKFCGLAHSQALTPRTTTTDGALNVCKRWCALCVIHS